MFARFIRAPLAAALFLVAHCAAAAITMSPSFYACPDSAPGVEVKCGTYTVKNTYTSSRNLSNPAYGAIVPTGFRLDKETCTDGKAIFAGATCTFSVYFTGQQTAGTTTYSSNLFHSSGNINFGARGNTTLSYSWVESPWLPETACASAITKTRTVVCRSSAGVDVEDALCGGGKPATTWDRADYSACTYSWQTDQWDACQGGSGDFAITSWAPSVGCGATAQNRTATCSVVSNSGTHERDVTCLRSNGTTVVDSFCDEASKPRVEESCTPGPSVCGTAPELQRTITLANGCAEQPGTEDPGNGSGSTPPPVKRELCMPDAANSKYCVYLRMH